MEKKIGIIIVLATLFAVSFVGNFLLLSTWGDLKNKVRQVESQNSSLEGQIISLQAEKNNLNQQNSQLSAEIASLKAARLNLMDYYWQDNHPLFGTPYVHVYGTVVNFGKTTAHNVVITVKIYEQAVLLKTENIFLEDIYGEWYGKFDVDIEYSGGDANSVDMSVSYT